MGKLFGKVCFGTFSPDRDSPDRPVLLSSRQIDPKTRSMPDRTCQIDARSLPLGQLNVIMFFRRLFILCRYCFHMFLIYCSYFYMTFISYSYDLHDFSTFDLSGGAQHRCRTTRGKKKTTCKTAHCRGGLGEAHLN